MSLTTDFLRITKSGFINFWRNGVVSLASILVFTVTLFIIGSLLLGSAVFNSVLVQAKDKIDVTVYFKEDAEESEMLALRDSIASLPEVKSAEYKSSEEVLAEFKEDHEDNSAILQSLVELEGENPLLAELNIKAHNPSEYASIVNYLEGENVVSGGVGVDIVDNVNFEDNRLAIEKFTLVTTSVERLGLYISILAALIAILVAFNTIRLAIYTSREEIGVMRLVGANNNYIRGPFVVEGIMYGIVASIVTLAIFYPITKWISVSTQNFYGAVDLFEYFIANFPLLFLVFISTGVLLGAISSFLAVRRYLKI